MTSKNIAAQKSESETQTVLFPSDLGFSALFNVHCIGGLIIGCIFICCNRSPSLSLKKTKTKIKIKLQVKASS